MNKDEYVTYKNKSPICLRIFCCTKIWNAKTLICRTSLESGTATAGGAAHAADHHKTAFIEYWRPLCLISITPVLTHRSHRVVRLRDRVICVDFSRVRPVSRFLYDLPLRLNTYDRFEIGWNISYDRWHDCWCGRRRFTSDCFKIYRKISRGRPRFIAWAVAASESQSRSQPVVRLVASNHSIQRHLCHQYIIVTPSPLSSCHFIT